MIILKFKIIIHLRGKKCIFNGYLNGVTLVVRMLIILLAHFWMVKTVSLPVDACYSQLTCLFYTHIHTLAHFFSQLLYLYLTSFIIAIIFIYTCVYRCLCILFQPSFLTYSLGYTHTHTLTHSVCQSGAKTHIQIRGLSSVYVSNYCPSVWHFFVILLGFIISISINIGINISVIIIKSTDNVHPNIQPIINMYICVVTMFTDMIYYWYTMAS